MKGKIMKGLVLALILAATGGAATLTPTYLAASDIID